MVASLTIPAVLSNLSRIRAFITQNVRGFCSDEDYIYDLVLAVDEAVTNIINHGYSQVSGKSQAFVKIHIEPQPDGIEVIIQDRAPLFDPTQHPAPDLHQPLELRPQAGWAST
jgi:serine/threonine-protein kinase RsbW